MKNVVFKFGGAALKSAESIKNIEQIIAEFQPKLIVVSAMAKTTNAFEKLIESKLKGEEIGDQLDKIRTFHQNIITNLFDEEQNEASENLDKVLAYCKAYLDHSKDKAFDEIYDQIIPAGELLSSKILGAYLEETGHKLKWLDARKILKTDNRFRKAIPHLEHSKKALLSQIDASAANLIQGFIGGTENNLMTTIGREGSDYSAALFANFIAADELVVWKDVDGVLNADPRYFNAPELIPNLSYKEAIELSYYGATIIHPKTIQPLAEKNIPLSVRSFQNTDCKGTKINSTADFNGSKSIYIYKPNQLLITLESEDLSFFGEAKMSEIYHSLFTHKLEVNLVQNSAVNCSICVDNDPHKTASLIEEFGKHFKVRYNENLELLTVRHYQTKLLEELLLNKDLIIEQKTRSTLKLLFK